MDCEWKGSQKFIFQSFQRHLSCCWYPFVPSGCLLQVENCGLSDATVAAMHKRGVTSLFPIQKHVFDPAMSGRDLIGRAKTGSGKTLAFSLPVIEKIMEVDNSSAFRAHSSQHCVQGQAA